MGKSKVTSVLLLSIIIFVIMLAFFVMDFKAAISETKFESYVSNASANNPSDPLYIDFSGGLYVYVMGDDDLSLELKDLMVKKLREKWSGIFEANSLEKNYDKQALIVTLRDRKISYNPFFPSARVEIILYYSSSGNTTGFEDFNNKKRLFANFERSGMVIGGRSELTDDTKGIISLRAYRKYLAEEITKNIVKQLPSGGEITEYRNAT
jgi:lipopolysaccharide export LptBFGC system permease protein LptF